MWKYLGFTYINRPFHFCTNLTTRVWEPKIFIFAIYRKLSTLAPREGIFFGYPQKVTHWWRQKFHMKKSIFWVENACCRFFWPQIRNLEQKIGLLKKKLPILTYFSPILKFSPIVGPKFENRRKVSRNQGVNQVVVQPGCNLVQPGFQPSFNQQIKFAITWLWFQPTKIKLGQLGWIWLNLVKIQPNFWSLDWHKQEIFEIPMTILAQNYTT